MNWSSALEQFLQSRFPASGEGECGRLSESGMKTLFADLGLGSEYAPVFSHLLAKNGKSGRCADLLQFLEVLLSGNHHKYCEYLFRAMDVDDDNRLDSDDLTQFAALMNDSLSGDDSSSIIRDIVGGDGADVGFDEFWNWYREEHALAESDERAMVG